MVEFIRKSLAMALVFGTAAVITSCGGQESYKTPIVNIGDITVTSKCPDESGVLAEMQEEITLSSGDKSISFTHSNIYLPRFSLIGILDKDGYISYESDLAFFYLDAGLQFIDLRERIKRINSADFCYFDLSVKITNISGGEYDFFLFDENDKLVPEVSQNIRVR